MTVQNDVVLWDSGSDKLCLFPVPAEQQYNYIKGKPCVTFKIAYQNEDYAGSDVFTLFDHFFIDTVGAMENVHHSLEGTVHIEDAGAGTDGYLDFTMSDQRLFVKGQLGATFSSHSLVFRFEADQTLVELLLRALSVELPV